MAVSFKQTGVVWTGQRRGVCDGVVNAHISSGAFWCVGSNGGADEPSVEGKSARCASLSSAASRRYLCAHVFSFASLCAYPHPNETYLKKTDEKIVFSSIEQLLRRSIIKAKKKRRQSKASEEAMPYRATAAARAKLITSLKRRAQRNILSRPKSATTSAGRHDGKNGRLSLTW